MPEVLWSPPSDVRRRSRMGAYLAFLERDRRLRFDDYDALWRWSVAEPAAFWSTIASFFEVRFAASPTGVIEGEAMPGIRWFPGATLNYTEHVLRLDGRGPDDEVIIGRSQTRSATSMTASELRSAVGRAAAALRAHGIGRGDRVAAYLPNIPETIVAALATATIGATWSSCAPEFGTRSVVDRFAQIEPELLLVIDGYRYGDKRIDRTTEVAEIRRSLPSVQTVVVVPYLDPAAAELMPGAIAWDRFLAGGGDGLVGGDSLVGGDGPGGGSSGGEAMTFEAVPFDHPLYILYSSGTTGLPKAIVHGHGGILLEHLKAVALHTDLGPADRFFWFTTTGWMMWNYLLSGLAAGATIVLFDGDPAHPDLGNLWRMAAETGVTYFGASAPFLMACRKQGIEPGRELDLSRLRGVGSTGAPLPAEGFRWVSDAVSPQVQLGSLSGGTDLCTGFLGPSPLVPVWAGEISCRMLGARVESFDPDGRPLVGREGELVITAPMPSMPVGFWNDPGGARYRAAYFEDFPGVWRHGDWLTITERGSCIITGRSDATLNRGGVRLGTAEFYAVVEALPEVADSLVVHLEDDAGGPGQLLLFVQLRDGHELDQVLQRAIVDALRRALSPRHVPDEIVAVPAIPRTLSGKKLEVPIKRILRGTPAETAASRDSLANPAALDAFVALARARSTFPGRRS